MSKVEFTIFLDEEKTIKIFQAIVASEQKYDITYDPNGLYESLLEDIVYGTYKEEYVEYELNQHNELKGKMDQDGNYIFETFEIIGEDSVENVKEFISFQNKIKEYICDLNEEPVTYEVFGVHLNGPEYGYGDGLMHPSTIARTISSVQKIHTVIANNRDYKSYLQEKAGSYEIHINATKRDEDAIKLFTDIYTQIVNKNLCHERYRTDNVYETVLNELNNLTTSKKLQTFSIFIDGLEKEITNIKYLKDFLKNPFGEEINKYQGILKSPDFINKTFEFKTQTNIWHCHLEEGCESLFSIIISPSNEGKKFELDAQRLKKATLKVSAVRVLN